MPKVKAEWTVALTDAQSRFVDEYMLDYNATQAAVRCGSRKGAVASVQGCRMLKNVNVRAEIERRRAERRERIEISQEMILEELAAIAFSNIGIYARWKGRQLTVYESSSLTPEELSVIEEISTRTNRHGTTLKIKLHDKLAALEKLMRILGMTEPPDFDKLCAMLPAAYAAVLRELVGKRDAGHE